MKRRLELVPILVALALAAGLSPAMAQWVQDGAAVCTAASDQRHPQLIPDGSGGVVIAWEDNRNALTDWDIYAQRVDARGIVRWTLNGVPVCRGEGIQSDCQLTSDGQGGAIIVWEDHFIYKESRLFAQRIDATGKAVWADDGVAVTATWGEAEHPRLVQDGSGGAIITWMDNRYDTYHIYAQRINATGSVLWQQNGIVVCGVKGTQESPNPMPDGAGGAIIVWNDNRKDCFCENDIYAQRVDGSGALLWPADGVAISAAHGEKGAPEVISDGHGGAIVTWEDERGPVTAQRVSAEGAVLWAPDGVALCEAHGGGLNPAIASDYTGGAIVAWEDYRKYSVALRSRIVTKPLSDRLGYILSPGSWPENPDIYAQRIDANGNILWGPDAAAICTVSGSQYLPVIAPNGTGGSIVAWLDGRFSYYDLYAQRVAADGKGAWAVGGAPLCTAKGFRFGAQIVPEGLGRAVVAWQDYRSGNYDIYAQQVENSGVAPMPVTVSLNQNFPNPFNPKTNIEYSVPVRSRVNLEIFDVSGRRVARLVDEQRDRGTYTTTWVGTDDRGRAVASGIYLCRLVVGDRMVSRKMVLLK